MNEEAKKVYDTVRSISVKETNDFETRLQDSIDKLTTTIKDSCVINDAYGNSLATIGTDDRVERFTNYGFSNDTLNWSLWTCLYNDSWVFRRAIDKPAQDEVRCGITIRGDFDKDEIYRLIKKIFFRFYQASAVGWTLWRRNRCDVV